MTVVRRLLLVLVLSFLSCESGIRVTGSPFAGEVSREGSEEESPRKRRRREDITSGVEAGSDQSAMVVGKLKCKYLAVCFPSLLELARYGTVGLNT